MTGTPVLQYKIPYDEWYIVITSDGIHFYFNEADRRSYWQLYNVFEAYPSIRKEEFVRSINYDDIALLMAKVNGLNIARYIKHDHKENRKAEENDVLAIAEDDNGSEEHNWGSRERDIKQQPSSEHYEDVEDVNEYDKDEQEKLLKSFLEEEGLVREPEEAEPPNEPQELKKVVLSLGYGSSSEEDEIEVDEHVHSSEQVNAESVEQEVPIERDKNIRWDSEIPTSDGDVENDLEFDLEGLELEEHDVKSKESDFFGLLDEFLDKFSVFDEWLLIEEELLPELVKHPSFYSVPDADERKLLFERWCKIQSEKGKPESDQAERNGDNYSSEMGSALETEQIEPASSSKSEKLYPTKIQLYFRYLLENKSMVKNMLYPEFIAAKKTEIDVLFLDLNVKQIENCFRQYRIMIIDFAQYEKLMKKQTKQGTNLKKLKLDNFLMLSKLENYIQKRNSKSPEVDKLLGDDKDYFDKWTELCNIFAIPPSIAENVQNFIVADEKRFDSYLKYIRSL